MAEWQRWIVKTQAWGKVIMQMLGTTLSLGDCGWAFIALWRVFTSFLLLILDYAEPTALALVCMTLVGCVTDPGKQLEQATMAHKQRQLPQKAFAVGYAPNGLWVAGWSYNSPTIESAKQTALRNCEEQAAWRGASVTCRVIYENDSFISQALESSSAPPPQPSRIASRPQPPTTQPAGSTGTGTFITADGLVLTANHVVRGASSIEVLTRDGRTLPARILSSSQSLDLAVLSTNAHTIAYFSVRLSKPTTGERVFTVGFPVPGVLGQEPKVSEGIVSAVSGFRDDAGFMQISIPIQPGSSGGPVLTEDGRLVGVITSTAAIAPFLQQTGTIPQNVNWAVHSSLAVTLLGKESENQPATTRKVAIDRALAAAVLIVAKK